MQDLGCEVGEQGVFGGCAAGVSLFSSWPLKEESYWDEEMRKGSARKMHKEMEKIKKTRNVAVRDKTC